MARLPGPENPLLSVLSRPGGKAGVWRWIAAGLGGLAAGAAGAHLLHTRGNKLVRNLGVEPGTRPYEPDEPDPGPHDYEAKEPARHRMSVQPFLGIWTGWAA